LLLAICIQGYSFIWPPKSAAKGFYGVAGNQWRAGCFAVPFWPLSWGSETKKR
jgi:hypothetical protein